MSHGDDVVLVASAGAYRLGAFLTAARALGRTVTVLTDATVPLGEAVHTVSLTAPESLASVATRFRRPVGAVVGVDGAALEAAAVLAELLGLDANPVTAVRAATHKDAQRRLVAELTQVAQPPFAVVPLGMDAGRAALDVGLPAVVKPVSLQASCGVVRVADPLDARAAAHLARSLAGGDGPVLVERFVPGGEVAVEGLLDHGELHVLAIFDKPDAPQGPTFPETMLVTPSTLAPAAQRRLATDATAVCRAIGLRHGPVHLEFRIDPRGTPVFLELAARTIGGRCASMLHFGAGTTLEELVLRQALGLPFDPRRDGGAVGVWMVPVPATGTVTGIDGVDRARRVPGVAEVVIDVVVGERVEALPRSGRYLGFVFARGEHPDEVAAALHKAAAELAVSTG